MKKKFVFFVCIVVVFLSTFDLVAQSNKIFEFYDAIPYQGKPDLSSEGLLPINLIYEASLTKPDPSTKNGIILDYDKINELAEMTAVFPHITVSTDVEHWFGDTSVDEYEMLYRFTNLFNRFRNYNPDVFIGNYGVAPSALCVYRFYDGGVKDEGTLLRDWRKNNQKRFRSLGAVDAAMPSVYIAEPNITSWIKDLQITVEEIRKYTNKKIIVYIWPQYYDKADSPYFKEFVSPEIWLQMLEAVYQYCDGAIIWSSTKDKDGNSIHWNEPRVQALWNVTKIFIVKYKNNFKAPVAEPELIHLDNPKKRFKIFNAITYSNTPDLKQYGLYDFQILTESQVTSAFVNGIYEPDSTKIANLAISLLNKPNVPIGVKAGTWIKDRTTDQVAMIARHEKFNRIFKSHNLHNPISFLLSTPSSLSGLRVTNSNSLSNQSNWMVNAVMPTRLLRDQVDILLPASYIIDDDTTIWKREFFLTVNEAKKNNPGKPVYAHFYVDYFNQTINFSNAYKPINNKSTFRTMLEAAFKICNGVVLNNTSSQSWNSNYGFWLATLEFLEAHKNNFDLSTGLDKELTKSHLDAISVIDKMISLKGEYEIVELFDLMGKKVFEQRNTINGLNFKVAKSGVYMLKLNETTFKIFIL